jgi:hypothetical protein
MQPPKHALKPPAVIEGERVRLRRVTPKDRPGELR